MKSKMLGALIVSVCLAGQTQGFGLLDTMLGSGCGRDCCEPQCGCEESCGCADDCCDDGCCEASCGCDDGCCEASCGCASNDCCKDKRTCFLSKLFSRKQSGCCEASCGCDDDCCDDGCCEASCGCDDDCCDDGCCEASCGCDDDCCCGSSSFAPVTADPSEAAAPIPPAPTADPAARIAQPRKVVSASFVR